MSDSITLGELINFLEKVEPTTVAKIGLGTPHSHRGYYHHLAFEPQENITVGEMLENCRNANGSTYTGWKGGEYTMDEDTECHIAYRGRTGDCLGYLLLRYMCDYWEED
jgi:hypothetical protein